mmetsp:Transcript_29267/g.75111  ORF Transcript_29267/g.75111 Transcript_29267/m.75111 type:complete len:140 (+) Transcript_29267:214-633(+)
MLHVMAVRLPTRNLGGTASLGGRGLVVRHAQPACPGRRGHRQGCQAMMPNISSANMQKAVRQAGLLLGTGYYGVNDLIRRWDATDPKIRPLLDAEQAKLQQLEKGYGIGNPTAREQPQLEGRTHKQGALPPPPPPGARN